MSPRIFLWMIVVVLLFTILVIAGMPGGPEWCAARYDDVRWFLSDLGILRR